MRLGARLEPLLALSGQGAPVESIARCVALGLVLGVCPVFGCPTLLCALAAVLLRLNLPAIQLVNYLATPLQVTLLFPFIRLGGWLFRGGEGPAIGHAAVWQPLQSAVTSGWHAVVAWLCVGAPAGLILYVCLVCVLRRYRSHGEETKRLCLTLS